jgi:anti-sigma-K factor RskA
MNLDDDLRRTLAVRPPPEGFEDRVAARVATARDVQARTRSSRPRGVWRWTAAAAVAALLVGAAGYRQQQAERREEVARAARDLRTALGIASDKLGIVQQHVFAASERHF